MNTNNDNKLAQHEKIVRLASQQIKDFTRRQTW